MGQKYITFKFEDLNLPPNLIERIKKAAQVAETKSLQVSIQSERYTSMKLADMFWRFNGYGEVYQFRLGMFWEAYFRSNTTIHTFCIDGRKTLSEIADIEEALGLQVVKRPIKKDEEVDIRIAGQPLEIITSSSSREPRVFPKADYRVNRVYLGRR